MRLACGFKNLRHLPKRVKKHEKYQIDCFNKISGGSREYFIFCFHLFASEKSDFLLRLARNFLAVL